MAHKVLKRLERVGQSLTLGAVARLLPPAERGVVPDWGARPHRVLYLRYDRIGDMIMATGLIRNIATSHPTIELDVLASPGNASVLDGNPYVRRVLRFDRRRTATFPAVLRELRAGGYDAVVDGMVLTPSVTMMLLMLATGARWRIGIGGRRNDFAYTLPVPAAPPGVHAIEQAAQTAIPFGIDPATADWRTELFLRDAERARAEAWWGPRDARPRFLVNVSAVTADRQWPADRFAAVLRHVQQVAAVRALVISAPSDNDVAARIAAEGGAEFVSEARIRDAFALVATADAVFTPDTSIAHAAAATGTPVAVMLRGGWTIHAPYQARDIRIESEGRTVGDLPVERVLPAVERLLGMARSG